jgi:hypothetical protein
MVDNAIAIGLGLFTIIALASGGHRSRDSGQRKSHDARRFWISMEA